MSHPNPSTAMGRVIADELARHGIRRAVVSPGSRSTALVLALAAVEGLELFVNVDERSAGFRALGHSASGGRPGLVVTTSGSAVANLLPAVVEADRSGIPLLLLTADRPAEMVARRTNQTMDQKSVFTGYVRGRFDIGPAVDEPGSNHAWRGAVAAAVAASLGGRGSPGPSQLNVAFEEPTVPVSDDGRASAPEYRSTTEGRGSGEPWSGHRPVFADSQLPVELGRRTVVIAGRGDYDSEKLAAVAGTGGIPVLATALSGCRGHGALSTYHHVLVNGLPSWLRPDAVVVVGQPGPSDRLGHLMTMGAPVVHVDRWGLFSDISGTMTSGFRDDPAGFIESSAVEQEEGWVAAWDDADSVVRSEIDSYLGSVEDPTGPGIARTLDRVDWSALVVSSSLPIRDVDAHLTRPGWVHSNRGVSGIDGFDSTVLGVADLRERTVAMTGDLSFLHDSNAFLSDRRPAAVFVVADNNGGGLFDLLPQAKHAADFERFFITPHGRDLRVIARFHGLGYDELDTMEGLSGVVGRHLEGDVPAVVRVRVDRERDLQVRTALDDVARTALLA